MTDKKKPPAGKNRKNASGSRRGPVRTRNAKPPELKRAIAPEMTEERYRAIVENQLEFVDRYLPGGILTYVNRALAEHVGQRPEDLIGKSFFSLLHADDREILIKQLDALTPEQPTVMTENRIIPPDGSVHWHQWSHQAFFDDKGAVVEYQSVGRNITRRRRVEEALHRAEAMYHELVETAQDLIWQCDSDGRYVYLNGAWEETLGYAVEEMLGRKFTDFQDIESERKDLDLFSRLLESGIIRGYESVHRAKDGRAVSLVFNAKHIRDEQGRIVGTRGTAHDVTERRRMEDLLRESEEKYRALVEASAQIVWTTNAAGEVAEYSPSWREYTGQDLSKGGGYGYVESFHPDDRDDVMAAWKEGIRKGINVSAVLRLRHHSGEWRWNNVRAVPIRDAAGTVVSWVGTYTDIHDRKVVTDALRENEQLLHSLVDSSADAIFVKDIAGKYVLVNEAASRLIGKAQAHIVGRTDAELFRPEDAARMREQDREVFTKATTVMYEHVIVLPGGSRTMQVRKGPLRDYEDRVVGIYGISRDITERKQAEEALMLSEHRLAESEHMSHTGSWEHNPGTNDIWWSDELFRLLGLDPRKDNADFGTFFSRIHPDDQPMVKAAVEKTLREKEPFDVEYRFVVPGEPVKIIHARAQLVPDARGQLSVLRGTAQDITERKQAEERLRESKELLNTILDNVGAAIFIKDANYRYVYANRKVCEIFGKAAEEILGKGDDAFFSQQSVREIMMSDRPVIEQGRTVTREEGGLTSSDGVSRSYWTVKLPLRDSEGKIYGICGIATDITERKQAEERLRESEDRFRSIFTQAMDGILLLDAERGTFVEANSTVCEMLGYSRDELLQMTFADIHPKEDVRAIRSLIDRQVRGEISLAENIPVRRKDGSVFFADINAAPMITSGRPVLVGIFRDITERREAEAELRLQGEIARNISEGIYLVSSKDLNILYANPTMERMFGYDSGEMNGKHVSIINAPTGEDPAQTATAIENALQKTGVWHGEVLNIRKDGTIFPGLASISMLHHPKFGEVYVSLQRDITELKRAEERILESEHFIRNILDTVDEGFIVVDRDYRIVTANNAYCSQAGMLCDDVIGKHCFAISHKALRPCYEEGEDCAVRHVFMTGEPHSVSHVHRSNDGHLIYVETKAFPIRDAQGNVTAAIEILNNITEKHLLEEERLKTQKLESIGTLAGGIAHDFNNLLQGVFGFISMAKLVAGDKEQSIAALDDAEKALHLTVKLTNQLLTFSKGGSPLRHPTDLRPVIENAVSFALSGSRTRSRFTIDRDLWYADADDGQVAQVIQNIVLNADQAMPLGGTVEISARNVAAPGEGISPLLREGKYVEITIADSGIGIPAQYLARIFDPYFTTKEKGSGLGLATSYSIVKSHGGAIDARSEVGKGTTFVIHLPAASAAPEAPAVPPRTAATRRGRILLMDDEEIVRKITGKLLEAIGHEAEFARNGEDALAAYRKAQDSGVPFDLVILDLTVRGGMGGLETLAELRRIDPAVKAVVSSGYSDDAAIAEYRQHGFQAFLKKPYDLPALNATLNALLE